MKKNLFRTMAIAASVTFAVSAGAQTFTWRDITEGTTEQRYSVSAIDNTTVFAGTMNGIFKSTNKGATWTRVLQAASSRVKRVYKHSSGKLVAIGNGAWTSTDNGDTWTLATGSGSFITFNIIEDNSGNLYIGNTASGSVGVYKSTDGGDSWTRLGDTGLPVNEAGGQDNLPGIFTEDGNTILFVFKSRVFRTTDGGATWSVVLGSTDPGAFQYYNIKKAASGVILLGLQAEGFYASTDNGASFSHIITTPWNGGPKDFILKGDTIISANQSNVIRYKISDYSRIDTIGSDANGIIGMSNTGLQTISVSDAGEFYIANHSKLFTTAAGDGITGINERFPENMISVYPNPVHRAVTLTGVPNGSLINIADLSGRILYAERTGTGTVTVNVHDFSPGIYFIKVENGGAVSSHKFIKE